ITGHVHPVARPVLPVLGGTQQAIGQGGIRCLVVLRDERGQFLRRRRQTGDAETHAPQQHLRRGGSGGGEVLLFETREDEVVDGVARPRLVLHHRQRRPHDRREGPVLFVFCTFGDPLTEQLL